MHATDHMSHGVEYLAPKMTSGDLRASTKANVWRLGKHEAWGREEEGWEGVGGRAGKFWPAQAGKEVSVGTGRLPPGKKAWATRGALRDGALKGRCPIGTVLCTDGAL
eukprot:246762-Chlamydomonas_euryale.AAC.1